MLTKLRVELALRGTAPSFRPIPRTSIKWYTTARPTNPAILSSGHGVD